MTGPEHYKEAERLIIAANSASPSTDVSDTIATAQVHATLALAAECKRIASATAFTAGAAVSR